MSPNIWTLCAGPSRFRRFELLAWRVVEAQHRVSTRALVDTLEEQSLLEEIVDEVKPPRPTDSRFAGLHFLLWTPFRHPPLRRGSRFGRRHERSLWYGAERLETSLAEKCYYQLLFIAGTAAHIPRASCDWTAFSVPIATRRGIDLTAPPFARHHVHISSPISHAASQTLGTAMRSAGVEAFRFSSARCPQRGVNVGLFEPAFAGSRPRRQQTWRCEATPGRCEVFALNSLDSRVLSFPRATYEVNGELPFPNG